MFLSKRMQKKMAEHCTCGEWCHRRRGDIPKKVFAVSNQSWECKYCVL